MKFKIGLALLLVLASFSCSYAIVSTISLQNLGAVKAIGIGAYWDPSCSNSVSAIDWGAVTPASVKNVTIYIMNSGNSAITLSLQTTNWNPPNASRYISLSWNYSGQAIAANSVIPVTLSLAISPDVQGINSFSFTTIISAV